MKAPRKPSSFHAVAIRCDDTSCPAAQRQEGQRFLSRDRPPLLPLKDCTQPERCNCRYAHHDDRRDDARRESDIGGSGIRRIPEKNRRIGRGRRADD